MANIEQTKTILARIHKEYPNEIPLDVLRRRLSIELQTTDLRVITGTITSWVGLNILVSVNEQNTVYTYGTYGKEILKGE